MAKKNPNADSAPGPIRVHSGGDPLPRVPLEEFREAQRDPKVKKALHDAQEEGIRLRLKGLIRD
jgi:hypothetical protein